jgi:hypothetical protein
MRKIIQPGLKLPTFLKGERGGFIIIAVFLFAGIAWAAPKYKIDSGSDMTTPPAIGATTPSTGKFTGGTFDFISVTHMSLTGMLSTTAIKVGNSQAGDMLGFIGDGQSSLVKSGPIGYVLKSGGVGVQPRWEAESGGGGSPDWTAPGTIGSTTPNTGKFTTLRSTTGVTVDAGGFVSTETVEAGGSGIIGRADSGVAIANNDRLGYYLLGGAKDAAHTMNNSAGMSAYATQAWSGSAAGAKLQFEVTPNGSTTRSTAVTIDQDSTATFVASKHTSLNSTALSKGGVPLATMTQIPMWVGTIASTSGAGVAYQATVSDVTSYAAGMSFIGVVQDTNTNTSPTLAVNGMSAKTIKSRNSTSNLPNISDLVGNGIYQFIYDGTNMVISTPDTAHIAFGTFSRSAAASPGTVAYTGIGFKPRFLYIAGATQNFQGNFSMGWTSGVGINHCLAGYAGATGASGESNCLMRSSDNGSVYMLGVLASFDNDGFSITYSHPGGAPAGYTPDWHYVAWR